jgi:hypothetical protein
MVGRVTGAHAASPFHVVEDAGDSAENTAEQREGGSRGEKPASEL